MRSLGLLLCLLCAPGAFALPEIQHWTTANGARVYFVAAEELPIIDARVVFDAGGARDGDMPGLAAMTNGMLVEGAGGLSADQIVERFDNLGAEFDNASLRDMAWYGLRCLAQPDLLEQALETAVLVLNQPDFPPDAFERERNRALAGLAYQKQSPGELASKAFYQAIYGAHPYGQPPQGTEDSLHRMRVADLRDFHARHYVAKNAVVAIVGALDKSAAEYIAQRLTGGLASGEAAPAPAAVPALADARRVHLEHPSSQTHILLGQPGMSRYEPDYFPLYVGNHILGGGGSVSRLAKEVREDRGLAYSVHSYFAPMRAAGPFVAGLQTRNDQVAEAMDVVRETLARFIETGPTAQELDEAKQNLTGGFPLDIDSNKEIIGYIAMIGFYGLPLDYLHTWTAKIEAVSAEQVRDAFQRHLHPDKMALITVGGAGDAPPAKGE